MMTSLTKDEVISRLSVKNETIKDVVSNFQKTAKDIVLRLVCVGGPFNDNKLQFTAEQLRYLRPVLERAEYINEYDCNIED